MAFLLQIYSGEIQDGISYQVVGGTSIVYNSVTYVTGSTFVGVNGISTFTSTAGTEIIYEATIISQLAIGLDQGKYLGYFNDVASVNQIAVGGTIVNYPDISGSIEIRQNEQNLVPVETKYLMDQVYVTTRVPNFAQGLTYDQIVAEALSNVNLSTTIEPISNITKVTISDYDGYMRYDRSYIGGDMNISYSSGSAINPIQGEIATYSFLASNSGYGGNVAIDVDFGGTIGTEQVTLYLAAFTTKTVTIEKAIPLTETGTLTVNVSDDVGSVEYNFDYNILELVQITVNKLSVDLQFNDRVLVDWGDGTESKGSGTTADGVHYTHTYSSVPQTLKVYNWYENNLRLCGALANTAECIWEAEISETVFPVGTSLLANRLVLSNSLDNNYEADFRNVTCSYLFFDNIKTLNFEGNISVINISLKDSIRTLTTVNVRNASSLVSLFNVLGNLTLWQGGLGHKLTYIDFTGTAIAASSTGDLFIALNNTSGIDPRDIIGVMSAATSIKMNYNNFGASANYFDFTPYHTSSISAVNLSNNNLTDAQVEEYCLRVKNMVVTSGILNGIFDISGNNAAANATALGYIGIMQGLGWTITSN